MYVNPRGGVEEDYPLDVHTRNFLDCVKSRSKPNADMEIGYHSALPCLLALESLQKVGRSGGTPRLGRARRCDGNRFEPRTPVRTVHLVRFVPLSPMKPELRVALLGQGFMGKAHSNAYCQVEHFYDCPTASVVGCCAAATPRRWRRWRIAGDGRRPPPTGAR